MGIFVLPIFLILNKSPSRSVTKISGLIFFSNSALTAPSATIFVTFLHFLIYLKDFDNDGPAPIMKTVLFLIIFCNCFFEFFLFNNEFNFLAERKSSFSEYPNSFLISLNLVFHPCTLSYHSNRLPYHK